MTLQQRELLAVGHVEYRDCAIMGDGEQAPISVQCQRTPDAGGGQFDFADDAPAFDIEYYGDFLVGTDQGQTTPALRQTTSRHG